MRYLFTVTAILIVTLASWIGLRFALAHRFAPDQSGVHGLAVNAPVDIVFLGSSHTRQSYDARLLEERTGKKVFLVAYNGLDPVSMVPVLKSMLEGGSPPKVLVMEAYGALWARPHEVQDSRLFFDAGPQLKAMLLEQLLRPKTLAAHRDAFELLVNRNNDAIIAYPLNRILLRNLSYHGAYGDKFVPGLSPERFAQLRIPLEGELHIHPEQRAALLEIVRLARERRVPVMFAESPLPGPVAARPNVHALKAEVAALAQAANVPYFDGEEDFPLTDPTLFADSNHLSTKGRALYTERVAAWLTATMQRAD